VPDVCSVLDVARASRAAGSGPRRKAITLFLAIAAVSVPAILIPLTYFTMSDPNQCGLGIDEMSAATQDEFVLTYFFAPPATALLIFAVLVRASPRRLRETRWRYAVAGLVAVGALVAVFAIAGVAVSAAYC
jgi:hypothetical protein